MTDTDADELIDGTTSVTVLPPETTVVCLRSVVAGGGGDVSGVLAGGLESAGWDGPAEVAALDGAGEPGASALVVTTALDGAPGTEVAGAGPAAGALVAGSLEAGAGVALVCVGCTTVDVEAGLLGGLAGTLEGAVCAPGGASLAGGASDWCAGAGPVAEEGAGVSAGIGAECCAGPSAELWSRPPGLSPPAGAGATVVVLGSFGAACDTWAHRRAFGAMAVNSATVAMVFFTQAVSAHRNFALLR